VTADDSSAHRAGVGNLDGVVVAVPGRVGVKGHGLSHVDEQQDASVGHVGDGQLGFGRQVKVGKVEVDDLTWLEGGREN
jgi:hypothetical protein